MQTSFFLSCFLFIQLFFLSFFYYVFFPHHTPHSLPLTVCLLFGSTSLTYLNERTMAVMIPVTNITIPRTQNRPVHLVKSTWGESGVEMSSGSRAETGQEFIYTINFWSPSSGSRRRSRRCRRWRWSPEPGTQTWCHSNWNEREIQGLRIKINK